MGSPARSTEEVTRFLRRLRHYRATLTEPAQLPLDALVTTGLGRTPTQPHPDGTRVFWGAYAGDADSRRGGLGALDGAATWTASPWGCAYSSRTSLE